MHRATSYGCSGSMAVVPTHARGEPAGWRHERAGGGSGGVGRCMHRQRTNSGCHRLLLLQVAAHRLLLKQLAALEPHLSARRSLFRCRPKNKYTTFSRRSAAVNAGLNK